ncbi:MAG: AraC family transcriptional regulator ligand-binding domain-containing protein, partial [Oceanococcus sp.]
MKLYDGYTQSLSLRSSVRLAYGLLPLVSFASRYPIDVDMALEQARIDRFGLMDPAYTISLDQELSLLSHVIHKLPDARLSLQLAQQYRLRGFSVLGLAMQASANPLAMLQLIMRYPRLAWGQFNGVLQLHGESLKIQFHPNPHLGNCEAFLLERDIACAFVLFEEALGKPVKIQSLSFQHAFTRTPSPYQAFFGCAVEFSSARNELVCELQELLQPLPHADDSMCEFYTAQCERMSQGMERNFQFGEAVTARLHTSPNFLNLQQLADAMLMTPRTLQRRLSAERLSFSGLLR